MPPCRACVPESTVLHTECVWSTAPPSTLRTIARCSRASAEGRPSPRTTFAVSSISRNCLADKRSEEHTSELQSRLHLVCRLLLEKKKEISRYSTASRPTTVLFISGVQESTR